MDGTTTIIPMADGSTELKLAAGPGDDYIQCLTRNGFTERLCVGDHPLGAWGYAITIYGTTEDDVFVVAVTDGDNGMVQVGAKGITEALDLAARWAPVMAATALACWPQMPGDFMLEGMPSPGEIEQHRALRTRQADREWGARERQEEEIELIDLDISSGLQAALAAYGWDAARTHHIGQHFLASPVIAVAMLRTYCVGQASPDLDGLLNAVLEEAATVKDGLRRLLSLPQDRALTGMLAQVLTRFPALGCPAEFVVEQQRQGGTSPTGDMPSE